MTRRLVAALAHDGEFDRSLGFAAHQLDRVVQAHALGALAVDMRDDVASQDASARRGRVFDGGNNLGHAIFAAYFDTQSAKTTLRNGFHFFESLGIEIRGMRVKVAEHALDGIVNQFMIGDGLDIAGFL